MILQRRGFYEGMFVMRKRYENSKNDIWKWMYKEYFVNVEFDINEYEVN